MEIKDLISLVIQFRDDRNWKQFHQHKDCVIGLSCEVAELSEHVKWKNNEEWKAYLENNKTDISDELADILYWVLLISNDWGVNLEESLKSKLIKNAIKYPINQ